MRCVLEVFERVLAIYKHCSQGVLHVLGMSRVGARDKCYKEHIICDDVLDMYIRNKNVLLVFSTCGDAAWNEEHMVFLICKTCSSSFHHSMHVRNIPWEHFLALFLRCVYEERAQKQWKNMPIFMCSWGVAFSKMLQGTHVLHLFLRFNTSRTWCSLVVLHVSKEVFPLGHTKNKPRRTRRTNVFLMWGIRNKFLICPALFRVNWRTVREHPCSRRQWREERSGDRLFFVYVLCVCHRVNMRGTPRVLKMRSFDCQLLPAVLRRRWCHWPSVPLTINAARYSQQLVPLCPWRLIIDRRLISCILSTEARPRRVGKFTHCVVWSTSLVGQLSHDEQEEHMK